jgi:hypothetical protein
MACLWACVVGDWQDAHAPPNCGIVLVEHTSQGYSPPRVIDDAPRAQHAGG